MAFKNDAPADEPVDVSPEEDRAPEPVAPAKGGDYIVVSRDTWGILEGKFGKGIAEKNGMTIHEPLIAGSRLKS